MAEGQDPPNPPRRRAPIGPTLPPDLQKSRPETAALDKRSRSRSPDTRKDFKASGRESWMTEMPEGHLRIDPANLKARTFFVKHASTRTSSKISAEDEERDREQEEFVRKYNQTHRPAPLVDLQQSEMLSKGSSKEKDSDEAEKRFDWERDMKQGIKAGSSKDTARLMSRMGGLSDRFSSGSSSRRFL